MASKKSAPLASKLSVSEAKNDATTRVARAIIPMKRRRGAPRRKNCALQDWRRNPNSRPLFPLRSPHGALERPASSGRPLYRPLTA